MANFRYKAVSSSGELVIGTMAGTSDRDVILRLQKLGHMPVRAEEISEQASFGWFELLGLGGRSLPHRALTLLTRELATLLHAGLPLDRALEILIGGARSETVKHSLRKTLERIRGGATLADALAANGKAFPTVYINTLRAGELGGSLSVVLTRLAEFLSKSNAIRESIKSALVYPIILLVMGGVSIVAVLTVVLPQFKPLFRDARVALPIPTQIALMCGEVLERYWWLLILLTAVTALGSRLLLRNPAVLARVHKLLLLLPLIGDVIIKAQSARLCRTVGTLLSNGMPLPRALAIAQDTLSNIVVAARAGIVATQVQEGRALADALDRAGIFPDLAVELVQVGEETGRLDEMAIQLADIYDQEIQQTIERLLALLVPIMTIALGAVIAAIIGSVLIAILSIYDLAV